MGLERLQKILARGGLASRRAAETLITEGRVRVNGHVVNELGAKADPRKDRIDVDGKRVVAEHPVYYALHKPRGYVTTLHDPEGRPTVANLLRPHGVEARVFPVGRLDFNTSGVILLTNDGEFSDGLLHPRKSVPKSYVVKVQGRMQPADIDRWRKGVELEDGKTREADAHLMRYEEDKTWFEITIREGRNQQIRRMGDATGFRVMRLSRVSFAGITSQDLRPGDMRVLTFEELTELKKEYGVPRSPSVALGPPRAQPKLRVETSRTRALNDGSRSATTPRGREFDSASPSRPTKAGPDSRETPRTKRPPRAQGTDRGNEHRRDPAGQRARHEQVPERPQSARGRHAYERPQRERPAPPLGGWRGHGPSDQDPRTVPRMPTRSRRTKG
ncbi:MAG: hypothetical protein NVSMB1_11250 [Polyangiales bacterium]